MLSQATVPTPLAIYRDIEYTRPGGVRLALDAAIPRAALPCPAVIVVHGGGWVRGDRRTDVEPLLQPLSDAGFAWFSIDYRLMTDVTQFGAAVEDVAAAIQFVKANAGSGSTRAALRWSANRRAGNWPRWRFFRRRPIRRSKQWCAFTRPTDLAALVNDSQALRPGFWITCAAHPAEGFLLRA